MGLGVDREKCSIARSVTILTQPLLAFASNQRPWLTMMRSGRHDANGGAMTLPALNGFWIPTAREAIASHLQAQQLRSSSRLEYLSRI
jgi:hypothetical protein